MAYYVSGFGPAEQQVTALVIWIPLQLAAFAIYPSFKVGIQHCFWWASLTV